MFEFLVAGLLTFITPASSPAVPTVSPAQQQPAQSEIDELRRRLDVLAQELERLRSGEPEEELTEAQRRSLGVAPSAAAIYRKKQGVSFAGYGEIVYQKLDDTLENGAASPASSRFDFLRAVLYAGYRFNDRFLFNSEIEFEHAGEEVGVEFAYVDYRVRNDLTLRGGLLLLPMGLINEFHEPTVYLGTGRPETERRIVPSTWRENGAGVLGTRGPVSFRAYVVTGLKARGFSANGIRGGRQSGKEAIAENFAFVGRADVTPLDGVFVGGSLYTGASGQNQVGEVDAGTTIGEVHGQAQMRGLDVRALYARASIDDAAALNGALKLTGTASVGSVMEGGYAQAGYNVLNRRSTTIALTPYYRFERVNTHAEVPAGFTADPAKRITWQTLGLELRPVTGVVVKTDYQWVTNGARTGRNQFNIALGYAF